MLQPVANVVVNGVLAALGQLTVGRAVAAWVLGQGLTVVVLAWYVAVRGAGFGRPRTDLARNALHFGVRAHAGRVLTLGNYRLDQWILGATRTKAELGVYSVAVALAETLFYLPEAVKQVARPRLARATRLRAAAEGAAVFRLTTVATAVIATPLVVFAPFVIRILFGDAFSGASPQLRLLALGAFGVIGMKILGNALTAQRRPGLESVVVAIAFAATIGLDVALIPTFGGTGAAIASTVSYLVGGIAVAGVYVRVLGVEPAALVPRRVEIASLVRQILPTAR